MRFTNRGIIGCCGLVLLSVLYCLPGHPTAGGDTILDVLLHAGLFAGIGLGLGWFTARGRWVIALLIVLASLLEVVQWWIAGYARIEVADILANELGVALAAGLLGGNRGSPIRPAGSRVDQVAASRERSRGWIVKEALTDWVEQEEERDRLTREALAYP